MPFGEEQVLQHLCSFTRLGHPFRALHGRWVSQRWYGRFNAPLRHQELLLCSLAHQQDQAIAVSHRSACRGSCGTRREKWGEAMAAVVPLLAPGLVSWG